MSFAFIPIRLAVVTLFTLGNGLCGLSALLFMLLFPGEAGVVFAGWMILLGFGLDLLDGLAARALGVQGRFGGELDSLCDAITFGVVPAILIVKPYGESIFANGGTQDMIPIYAASAIYLSAVLIRLARFNATVEPNSVQGHLWFTGLPSPVAALWVGSFVIMTTLSYWETPLGDIPSPPLWGAALGAIVIAGLMVSKLPYADLPKHYVKGSRSKWSLLPWAILMFFVTPVVVVFLFFSVYLLSPAVSVLRKKPTMMEHVSASRQD
uniref:CDP-diacylglycerol---serine O-phosphatidyltransferase n=1 Tax=Candidatus Kentrum sp. FW TaxID=2126338 RepID=A0A450TPX5_9GAMM|nr:MAG: CDP-diacylglycerol---serine O-phosphatidyltransferase [Candidatus Kentron sp. FW]